MGCLPSKPSPPHSNTAPPNNTFRSSHYGAQEEQRANVIALGNYQVGLGSRRASEYKKLIAQDQKYAKAREKAEKKSRANRTEVIDGETWFY